MYHFSYCIFVAEADIFLYAFTTCDGYIQIQKILWNILLPLASTYTLEITNLFLYPYTILRIFFASSVRIFLIYILKNLILNLF